MERYSRTALSLLVGAGVASTPAFGMAVVAQAAPAVSAPAASASTSRNATAVAYAVAHISSAEYLWGGEGPTRFDCSGLTMMAWRAAGVNIPHNSTEQLNFSPKVSRANIAPGDLVVYSFSSFADHVAMYVGPIGPNGEDLVDTASRHPGGGVNWSSMASRGGSVAGIVRPAPLSGGTTVPPVVTPPSTPPVVTPPAPSGGGGGSTTTSSNWHGSHASHAKKWKSPAPAEQSVYTVQAGDTLSGIAQAHGTTWQLLYGKNASTIANPDLIYPGQVINL